MTDRQHPHRDLIRRACSDPNAFAELYLLHYEDVFGYCIRRLFDRHLAEDVTSTVFFKVMNGLGSFDGDAAAFRRWLFRIATNAVNDHLRQAKRHQTTVERIARDAEDKTQVADTDHDLIEKKARLKRALLSLKPTYQTVIALRFFENMKLSEIGDCLEENPSTIRTRLSRATAQLRQALGDHGTNMG